MHHIKWYKSPLQNAIWVVCKKKCLLNCPEQYSGLKSWGVRKKIGKIYDKVLIKGGGGRSPKFLVFFCNHFLY